ncbi:MAG: VWA domain-containing protein [Lentisphaeria bacterium]|nr:VWA domain-containing protein [Lentisphaeria bacterium]
MKEELYFAYESVAWHLLWLIPLFGALSLLERYRRRRWLLRAFPHKEGRKFATREVSRIKRMFHRLFFALVFVFLLIALLRPQYGEEKLPETASGHDVLFLLDVSRSMLAQDINPDRLQYARSFILEIAKQLPGDRFGLIPFSGKAFLQCPLTSNLEGFELVLLDNDTSSIPVGGSNIENALSLALEAFEGAQGDHQAIVLLTDGEEMQGSYSNTLEQITERNIPIYSIGLGDPKVGSYIQLQDRSFIRDNGKKVRTRLDESILKKLAVSSNGLYLRGKNIETDAEKIADRILGLSTGKYERKEQVRRIDRYQWPLSIAVFFFLLNMLFGERRRIKAMTALLFVSLSFSIAAQTPPATQEPITDSEIQEMKTLIDSNEGTAAAFEEQMKLVQKLIQSKKPKFLKEARTLLEGLSQKNQIPWRRTRVINNLGVLSIEEMMINKEMSLEDRKKELEKVLKIFTEALVSQVGPTPELTTNYQFAWLMLKAVEEQLKMQEQQKQQQEEQQQQMQDALDEQRKANEERQKGNQQQAQQHQQKAQEKVEQAQKTAEKMQNQQNQQQLEEIKQQQKQAQQGNEEAGQNAEKMLEQMVKEGQQQQNQEQQGDQGQQKSPEQQMKEQLQDAMQKQQQANQSQQQEDQQAAQEATQQAAQQAEQQDLKQKLQEAMQKQQEAQQADTEQEKQAAQQEATQKLQEAGQILAGEPQENSEPSDEQKQAEQALQMMEQEEGNYREQLRQQREQQMRQQERRGVKNW